ncbi:MAG: uroporphyrinogen-III synthase [Paracoccaceae bacterium]
MSDPRPIILLTRAQAQSERLAKALQIANEDAQIIVSPVLEIAFEQPDVVLPKKYAFIATSENALLGARALGLSLRGKIVWCVGPKTAQAAKDLGAKAIQGPGEARGLAQAIIKSNPQVPLIYLRGEHVSLDLEEILVSAGLETVSYRIYRQIPCEISPKGKAVLAGARPVILPIYSQMSARRLGAQIGPATAPLHLVAISEEVAKSWPGPKPAQQTIARNPTHEAMLRAIRSQFD